MAASKKQLEELLMHVSNAIETTEQDISAFKAPSFPIYETLQIWDAEIQKNPTAVDLKAIRRQLAEIGGSNYQKNIAPFILKSGESTSQVDNIIKFDTSMRKFLTHDFAHLSQDGLYLFWLLDGSAYDDSIKAMTKYRDDVLDAFRFYQANQKEFMRLTTYPLHLLSYVAESELGVPKHTQTVKLGDMATLVGRVLQYRTPQLLMRFGSQVSSDVRNELVVSGENVEVDMNIGIPFSLLYNLAKNSYKKTTGLTPESGYKIEIATYQLPNDLVGISVSDSGKPVDIMLMKDKIREHVLERGASSIPSTSLERKMQNWQKSPYAVGELQTQDLVDVAFMAHMSGFNAPDTINSGMGLYGAKYLVEDLGGRILYGEDFQTGGPIFTCILPRQAPMQVGEKKAIQKKAKRVANELRYAA
jgi:hypothetical protein